MTSRRGILSFYVGLILLGALLPFHAFAQIPVPKNIAAGANEQCAAKNSAGKELVYTLGCKIIEEHEGEETGRIGGLYCPCQAYAPDGTAIVGGQCVDKGVCRATAVAAPPTTGGTTQGTGNTLPSGGKVELTSGGGPGFTQVPVIELGSGPATGVSGAYSGQGSLQGSTQNVSPSSGGSYSGGYTGGYSGGAVSGINGIAGYSGFGALPASTLSPPPTGNTGLGWAHLGQYVGGLSGQYPIQVIPAPAYYPADQIIAAPASFAVQGTNLVQPSQAFYRPLNSYDSIYGIIAQARDTLASGISGIYESLTGIADAPSNSAQTQIVDSVFETEIGETGVNTGAGISASGNEANVPQQTAEVTQALARSAVHEVKQSLKTLNETLAARKNATSSASIHVDGLPGGAAATSSGKVAIPANAAAAIKKAEERVAKLQDELEKGQSQLKKSDAKVQELTRELNALNQRIQSVNSALNDPEATEDERNSLIGSLITNIQLSVDNIERSLQEATAENEPETIGKVIVESISGLLAAVVQITVQVSVTLSEAIQSFWKTVFSA
jgi:hypothetical protein